LEDEEGIRVWERLPGAAAGIEVLCASGFIGEAWREYHKEPRLVGGRLAGIAERNLYGDGITEVRRIGGDVYIGEKDIGLGRDIPEGIVWSGMITSIGCSRGGITFASPACVSKEGIQRAAAKASPHFEVPIAGCWQVAYGINIPNRRDGKRGSKVYNLSNRETALGRPKE
jgi:hypothetical protein